LEGIRACVFDAYGTLFDFASPAAACGDLIGDKLDRLNALWRDKQLQYTWLRGLQGRHADFWQVTGDALDFALETLAIDNPKLPTYVKPAAERLDDRGYLPLITMLRQSSQWIGHPILLP
jgi:HAD superfamily hydrolase (TIGR01493 family)